MASRRGVLGDAHLKEACEEYKPLPIGFANANFQGNLGNPFLPGIKTPKYQRAAIRPVSADVLAVAAARLSGAGNQAVVAREMLEKFIKDGARFKPVPVQIRDMTQNLEDMYAKILDDDDLIREQAFGQGFSSKEEVNDHLLQQQGGPLPKVRMASRGERILKQTIGQDVAMQTEEAPTAAASPSAPNYMSFFSGMMRNRQKQVFHALKEALATANVDVQQYDERLRHEPMQAQVADMIRVAQVRGITGLDLDDLFGVPEPVPPRTPAPPRPSPRRAAFQESLRGASPPRVRRLQGISLPTEPRQQSLTETPT